MSFRRLGLMPVLIALSVSLAAAQGSGLIEGRVTDESGRGVGAVSVVIHEISAAELTDSKGNFAFRGVPAGTYSVTFTLRDQTDSESGVQVSAGQSTQLDKSVDWEVGIVESITVFSASRRRERIVDAPAAVTVINEEQIEKQASHGQVPKLLEFTPGVEVTQSGLYDFNLNTRGFNSSLNRRVATLIDGRDVSLPFLGAQEWAAVSFPLDDIASIELVRGPSAALYGANASSGVLNMTTKQPRYSEGGTVRITGGELDTFNADLRWASEIGNDWFIKLTAGSRDHGDFAVSRFGAAEYSVPCPVPQGSATDCLPQEVPLALQDDVKVVFGSVRMDKYLSNGMSFTLEGGTADIEGPIFQTGIGRVQVVNAERPWARFNWSAKHWNVLGTYTTRDADQQLALSSGVNLVLDTERVGIEVQTHWDFADEAVRLVAGASHLEEDIQTLDPATGRQILIFAPLNEDKQALFAQVDWRLSDHVKLVLAGRYDESSLHDSEVSPKGSIVYNINDNHTLRATYNEAFQVANYSEFFLQADVAAPVNLAAIEPICAFNNGGTPVDCGFGSGATRVLALGNESLELEQIETVEVGYTGIIGGRSFVTLDLYESSNENFITDLIPHIDPMTGMAVNPNFGPYMAPAGLDPVAEATLLGTLMGALGPTFLALSNNLDGTPIIAARTYTNFGAVDTQGLDFGLNHYFNDKVNLAFNYSYFEFDIESTGASFENQLVPNSPKNKGNVGIGISGDRADLTTSVRYTESFRWVVGPFQGNVDSYYSLDFAANWRVANEWSLGVNVANAFDNSHHESFGGDLITRRALVNLTYSWE